MRVVRVREFGPPQVMRTEETETPRPSAGQVVVAVEVAGVIYGETIVRSGRHPLPLPYEPGMEVGGRVVEVGPDTDPSLEGRLVVATTLGNAGGYADAALAEAGNVYPVPEGLPLEKAVPVFQAGAVSAGILSAMRVRAGETVLVTAAGGRIGSLLVQLARTAGARVIGAVGGPGKVAAAKASGADAAVDYSRPDWVAQVRAATDGRGADVVLDAIGGTVGEQALEAMADGGGRFGVYGFASGTWVPLDAGRLVRRGLSVIAPLAIAFAKPAAEQRADAERALDAAAAGELVPRVHAVYPLEQAPEAHADLEERRSIGAVLLRP
jgi:NADPH:quinone reductase